MKSKPLKERNNISYIFCIIYHFQGKTDLRKGIQETFSHLITFWKMQGGRDRLLPVHCPLGLASHLRAWASSQ